MNPQQWRQQEKEIAAKTREDLRRSTGHGAISAASSLESDPTAARCGPDSPTLSPTASGAEAATPQFKRLFGPIRPPAVPDIPEAASWFSPRCLEDPPTFSEIDDPDDSDPYRIEPFGGPVAVPCTLVCYERWNPTALDVSPVAPTSGELESAIERRRRGEPLPPLPDIGPDSTAFRRVEAELPPYKPKNDPRRPFLDGLYAAIVYHNHDIVFLYRRTAGLLEAVAQWDEDNKRCLEDIPVAVPVACEVLRSPYAIDNWSWRVVPSRDIYAEWFQAARTIFTVWRYIRFGHPYFTKRRIARRFIVDRCSWLCHWSSWRPLIIRVRFLQHHIRNFVNRRRIFRHLERWVRAVHFLQHHIRIFVNRRRVERHIEFGILLEWSIAVI